MPLSSSLPRFVPVVASLVLLTLASGCESRASSKDAPSSAAPPANDEARAGGGKNKAEPAPASAAGAAGATANQPATASRALVVTIDLAVTSRSPDVLADRLRAEAERAGGFVADATASGSGDGRSSRLVLRMPVSQARGLRGMLADYGKITTDTEKSEDVTEQRADLGARLSNAQAQEKRLVEIMAHRTGGVSEVLEVERELGRVRETIERFDAQKRALDGKIDLATVTVSITTPASAPPPPAQEGAIAKISGAFHAGVHATGVLILWAAMAFAATSPVVVPLALLATALVVVLRRRRRHRAVAAGSRPVA